MAAELVDLGPVVMEWLDELAECSEDSAELTRRYLTPESAQAAELIMRRMRDAGMSARLDAVGNVVGSFYGCEIAYCQPDYPYCMGTNRWPHIVIN